MSGKEVEISHGVGIVATGGQEYKPTEYLYGQARNIVTQKEFEYSLLPIRTLQRPTGTSP